MRSRHGDDRQPPARDAEGSPAAGASPPTEAADSEQPGEDLVSRLGAGVREAGTLLHDRLRALRASLRNEGIDVESFLTTAGVIDGPAPEPLQPTALASDARLFASPVDWLKSIRFPRGSVMGEISSGGGMMSRAILEACAPATLHLFASRFDALPAVVRDDRSVTLHEGIPADLLGRIPDNSLDLAVIESPVSKADSDRLLQIVFGKLKPGGYLNVRNYTSWSILSGFPYGIPAAVNSLANRGEARVVAFVPERLGYHQIMLRKAGHATASRIAPPNPEQAERLREMIQEHAPPQSIIAVISDGDAELLCHHDRECWHFPQDERGEHARAAPTCDLAAIAQLESLRARGAAYLLVPEPQAEWLTTIPGFHRHLDLRYGLVAKKSGVAALYALAAGTTAAGEPAMADDERPLSERLERLCALLGRPPQVLDLADNGRIAALLPLATVFKPPVPVAPGPQARLPYLDASIDMVAVASPSADLLAEASRVAAVGVIDCGREPKAEWLRDPAVPRLPSVSIVIPVYNQWMVTRACLRALWSTLPVECDVEVIVVDDCSTDETPRELAAIGEAQPRLRALRNENNLGFVETCNNGAAAARGDILVFLNNDTVALPGWLEPLIRTFSLFPRAGAVGGKLLFPTGALQEAGGIVFRDASGCHFGRGEANPLAQPFNFVRQVDYVSGALLATPRSLFKELGGFDLEFAPGYYEDTDYCFRLRERGTEVYYQPDSVVIHLEGATAGRDPSVGMKRHQELNRVRFQSRHAAALGQQRTRPVRITGDSWIELARR